MSESQNDCRRLPFLIHFIVALALLLLGFYGLPATLQIAELDRQALVLGSIFAGAAMLAITYVDAFRSRCIRTFMTAGLILLAVVAFLPVALARGATGPHTDFALGLVYLIIALLVFLHFSLHTMPSEWRQRLTPLASNLIGVLLAATALLYWEFGNRAGATPARVEDLVTGFSGIALGGLLGALLMRHRHAKADTEQQ